MFGWFRTKPDENRVRDLVRDLFTIQVNTILKAEITSSAMPDVRVALCDIAARYHAYLVERGTEDLDTLELRDGRPPGSLATFEALTRIAETAKSALGEEVSALDEETQVDFYRLSRIRSHSEQIQGCLRSCARRNHDAASLDNDFTRAQLTSGNNAGIADLDFERSEYATVRKVWEIGLERVAMQTVIELDGDVFTRIRPEFARDTEHGLQGLHEASVQLGVGHWATVVEIVGRVASAFTNSLTGLVGRRGGRD